MADSIYKGILFINEYTGDKGACEGCSAAVEYCNVSTSTKVDYIELYNSGECIYTDGNDGCNEDGSINLNEFQVGAITEEDGTLFYTLPEYEIPSKGFMFLCATGANTGHNTNFSIKKGGGETLYFKDPDFDVATDEITDHDIDNIVTIDTDGDLSHSRICNGGNWADGSGTPSPGTGIDCNSIVYGCTDESACNYDESVTDDDGSCTYPISCLNTFPVNICLDACPEQGTGEILINEITSKGTSHTLVYADLKADGSEPEDYYIPRDWVELYNPGVEDVNIKGWTFTDKDYPNETDQRNIMPTDVDFIIPAKGFAIVVVDDCDGNTTGPWYDRYCYDHPGEQNNATIYPGQGVHIESLDEGNTAIGNPNTWDRIYTNYPEGTPGVIRLSFKLGGGDSFKIYNGDPENPTFQFPGQLVDQFKYDGNPAVYSIVDETDEEQILDQSIARLWDGGPWGEIRGPYEPNPVTYGTSNGNPPPPDEAMLSDPLNLITIAGKYGMQGITNMNPSNDVISIIYDGKSYQITNDDVVDVDGTVKYSVTFDGEDLSEYAVGFNLRTEIDGSTVVLRSADVVPVTNILGGQIQYNFNFLLPSEYIDGCTDPTASNYESLATRDSGCEYLITGCSDIEACSCNNPLCLQYCEFCGTEEEYRCVSERGFYNQNPFTEGDNSTLCQYPPSPIEISFFTDSLSVEDFIWETENRLYPDDSEEEFFYSYLDATNFNNPIVINFNDYEVSRYSFSLNGLYVRECVLEESGANSDCSIDYFFDNQKTIINVDCNQPQTGIHTISCSVDDIIKLHTCIEDIIFIDENSNELESTFGDGPISEGGACFDLNVDEDVTTRLIKLNKLNGKMYTHITDLHRGENAWSTPVLSPFCCKSEWEEIELVPAVIEEPTCTGTHEVTVQVGCEGTFSYTCPASNSGDINGDGLLDILDIVAMVNIILTDSSVDELYTDFGSGFSLCDYINVGDINQDLNFDILDLVQIVNKVLEADDAADMGESSTFDCSGFFQQNGICHPNCNAIFETVTYDCSETYGGLVQGYNIGTCPDECTFFEGTFGDELVHPITGLSTIKNSLDVLKCGDSYPSLGIIKPEDFHDYDIDTLLDFYQRGHFLEYEQECLDLNDGNSLHISPEDWSDWRGGLSSAGTGPFRDHYYAQEYLGANVGKNIIDTYPPNDTHSRYGALQISNVPSGLFKQLDDGINQLVGPFQSGLQIDHARSFLIWSMCNTAGNNGVNDFLDAPGAPALVNDLFCKETEPLDEYSSENPYGWVAKACCDEGEVRNSFKIPYYGVLPFFNTEEYYYKYSKDNTFGDRYTMGYVPPCKEFLYDKITTALAFDETLSDIVDELGFSYSIKVIEFETELISHVIISGDTLPSIWLGTLTDLNIGEGYTIDSFDAVLTGSDIYDVEDNRLVHFRFQMEYDQCGVCSNGSALHISNSDIDDNNLCCLYPNKIINYYQEDNEFGTGIGKTYLDSLRLCDDTGETYQTTINNELITYHSEYNSDDCPGTLDCLGVCHQGISLTEAQLLTTYAQIDKYGGCCLQGNIDLCGICYGDSTAEGCNPAGFDNIFSSSTFNITLTQQYGTTISSLETSFNKGEIVVEITNEIGISEIKFRVVGTNITSGNFGSGLGLTSGNMPYFIITDNPPDFEIFTTPVENENGEQFATDIVIAPILSDTLFPEIEAGSFSIQLMWEDILYNLTDYIINEGRAYIDYNTIEVFRFNQSVGTTNIENLYTETLNYYGCGDPLAANYDEVCFNLEESTNPIADCIQTYSSNDTSYCIFTERDCAGIPGTEGEFDNNINSCGICIGPDAGAGYGENTNGLEEPFTGEMGQDCNGDCFGTAHINICNECVLGNTSNPFDLGQDCAGNCDGSAVIDDCGVCDGLNSNNLGCGCFAPAPVIHYIDNDYDGLGFDDETTNQEFCLVVNDEYENDGAPTYTEAPDNYSPVFGDTDPICPVGTQYDCAGNCIIGEPGMICLGELTPGNPDPTCNIEMVAPLVYDYCGDCGGDCVEGDPDSCDRMDECGVCDGDGSTCADCAGVPNGDNYQDCNGVCSNDEDFIGNTEIGTTGQYLDDFGYDCGGVCGGSDYEAVHYFDGDGDGIGCEDVTTWTGCTDNSPPNYVLTPGETGDSCNCPDTCDPIGFNPGTGSLSCIDECGICAGENLDQDCDGDCFGTHLLDDCGVCYDSATEDPPNLCVGCSYTDADNYGGDEITIDDGSCEYDELIRNIYESPAIYIQGGMVLNFIGFFLPDNISENIKSSQPLICAGTKGNNPEGDAYCAESGYEGEPCGSNIPFTCQEYFDYFGSWMGFTCEDIGCDIECNGTPDCDMIASIPDAETYGLLCQTGIGVCEKYEIHRILVNSFYDISTNPDEDENPTLQEFSSNDYLRIITHDSNGTLVDEGAFYNDGVWDTSSPNHHFRVGVGYYLRTENSGWFKLTPTRSIFDWEEEE